jgi:hypothetical protein
MLIRIDLTAQNATRYARCMFCTSTFMVRKAGRVWPNLIFVPIGLIGGSNISLNTCLWNCQVHHRVPPRECRIIGAQEARASSTYPRDIWHGMALRSAICARSLSFFHMQGNGVVLQVIQ